MKGRVQDTGTLGGGGRLLPVPADLPRLLSYLRSLPDSVVQNYMDEAAALCYSHLDELVSSVSLLCMTFHSWSLFAQ